MEGGTVRHSLSALTAEPSMSSPLSSSSPSGASAAQEVVEEEDELSLPFYSEGIPTDDAKPIGVKKSVVFEPAVSRPGDVVIFTRTLIKIHLQRMCILSS